MRWPLLLPIETFGLLVKCVSLTLRLAANMTAGHIILAVLMGFLTLGVGVWAVHAVMLVVLLALYLRRSNPYLLRLRR